MQIIVSKAEYLTLAFRKLLLEMCLPIVPHWSEAQPPLLSTEQSTERMLPHQAGPNTIALWPPP